ncbi:MAG: hypothetical protein M3Q55_10040 [Acidobacteriota bacterium]|nr:hypothetical protein [Acidobacteriota bacterium]
MADVLVEFQAPVQAPDGTLYLAQACGAPASDGTERWEGWIEFVPADGGGPVRSRRETTQPNRKNAAYWASGLSPVYLEGTLKRALDPGPATARPKAAIAAAFDGPAPSGVTPQEPDTPTVLNPFSVYRKGEELLRRQLGALSAWHLANILRGYELSDAAAGVLERMPETELIELIVAGVAHPRAEDPGRA